MTHTILPLIEFSDFLKLDIRSGTILSARINAKAKKPAYVLNIDFGEYGVKTTSAQITENYTLDSLIGTQVIAVMNFRPKKVADILSEVLILGVVCSNTGTVLIRPSQKVENGMPLL